MSQMKPIRPPQDHSSGFLLPFWGHILNQDLTISKDLNVWYGVIREQVSKGLEKYHLNSPKPYLPGKDLLGPASFII